MNTSTLHPYATAVLAAMSALVVGCSSAGSVVASDTTDRQDAAPQTSAPIGDPTDSSTAAGVAYCGALDTFFVELNGMVSAGIASDGEAWEGAIGRLDTATVAATGLAPENHAPILGDFGGVVSRMAALDYAEYQATPSLDAEASDFVFGELFVIDTHATEVCMLNTDIDVEIGMDPGLDVEVSATCEAVDSDYFRITWTNDTGADVATSGEITFVGDDGTESIESFQTTVVPIGERVDERFFAFDGTLGSCTVSQFGTFPLADNMFYAPAEPDDSCSVTVGEDGVPAFSVDAIALNDGDLWVDVGFYSADGVRVASAQFAASGAVAGETVTMTEPNQDLDDTRITQCEVLGRSTL